MSEAVHKQLIENISIILKKSLTGRRHVNDIT